MDILSIRVCILLCLTAWYAIPSFAENTSIHFDHHPLFAKVQLVASGSVSASATDLSNLDEILEEGTPHNRLGGFSAIEYQGRSNRYWILPDRGPSDGAAEYACRVHEVELDIEPQRQAIHLRLSRTMFLTNDRGQSLVGALNALPQSNHQRGNALDPEGIRQLPNGELMISDEYGPGIDIFSNKGQFKKSWPLPVWMHLTREKDMATATQGAMPNRGLEGIAIMSDQGSFVAAMQGPLVQDSEPKKSKRYSPYTRLIHGRLDDDRAARQYLYPLTHPSTGISEILSYDEEHCLVLERDGEQRPDARIKAIYVAKFIDATDVSGHSRLPSKDLPSEIRVVEKQLLIDLLDPRWSISARHRLEKPEGITWGEKLDDGRRLLIVCFDNDFQSDVESLFLAFAL